VEIIKWANGKGYTYHLTRVEVVNLIDRLEISLRTGKYEADDLGIEIEEAEDE